MMQVHRDVVRGGKGDAAVGMAEQRDVLRVCVGIPNDQVEGGQPEKLVRLGTPVAEDRCDLGEGRELLAMLELAIRVRGVDAQCLGRVFLMDAAGDSSGGDSVLPGDHDRELTSEESQFRCA